MSVKNPGGPLAGLDDDGIFIAYKSDDFMNYVECAADCLDCLYFYRFDICSHEYTTNMLDYYPGKEFLIMPSTYYDFSSVDISSRPKRRRAVSTIVDALSHILSEENAYIDRIPPNLHCSDAYVAADESADMLIEAIETLTKAY